MQAVEHHDAKSYRVTALCCCTIPSLVILILEMKILLRVRLSLFLPILAQQGNLSICRAVCGSARLWQTVPKWLLYCPITLSTLKGRSPLQDAEIVKMSKQFFFSHNSTADRPVYLR